MKEMVGGCCVCSDESGSPENPLVYCDGDGCTVAVHQACYGIVSVPPGSWYCKRCESQERAVRVRCCLCPSRDGALKRTDSGDWAHVVCALYIPEVRFANVTTMEPIMLHSVPQDRWKQTCYLCEQAGKEERAKKGACMPCNKPNCKNSFHVTCGQAKGLLCEEQGRLADDNVKYCGYCNHHFQRILSSYEKVMSKDSRRFTLVAARKDYPTIKPIPAFRPVPSARSAGSPDSSPEKKSPASYSSSGYSSFSSKADHAKGSDDSGKGKDLTGRLNEDKDSAGSKKQKKDPSSRLSVSGSSSSNSHSSSSTSKKMDSSSSSSSLSKDKEKDMIAKEKERQAEKDRERERAKDKDSISSRPFDEKPAGGSFSLSSFIDPKLANKNQTKKQPELSSSTSSLTVSSLAASKSISSDSNHKEKQTAIGSSSSNHKEKDHPLKSLNDKTSSKLSSSSSSTSKKDTDSKSSSAKSSGQDKNSDAGKKGSSGKKAASSSSSEKTGAKSKTSDSSSRSSKLKDSPFSGSSSSNNTYNNNKKGAVKDRTDTRRISETSTDGTDDEPIIKKSKLSPALSSSSSSLADKSSPEADSISSSGRKQTSAGNKKKTSNKSTPTGKLNQTISSGTSGGKKSSSSAGASISSSGSSAAGLHSVTTHSSSTKGSKDKSSSSGTPVVVNGRSEGKKSSTTSSAAAASSSSNNPPSSLTSGRKRKTSTSFKSSSASKSRSKGRTRDSDDDEDEDHDDEDEDDDVSSNGTEPNPDDEDMESRVSEVTSSKRNKKSSMNIRPSPSPSLTPMTSRQLGSAAHSIDMGRSFVLPNPPSAKSSSKYVTKDPTDPPPSSLESLLEFQWKQGAQFVMEQAQHYDIATLLSCMNQMRRDNEQLEERLRQLSSRRDQLLAVNARLALPLNGSFPGSLSSHMPVTAFASAAGPGLHPSSALPPFLAPQPPSMHPLLTSAPLDPTSRRLSSSSSAAGDSIMQSLNGRYPALGLDAGTLNSIFPSSGGSGGERSGFSLNNSLRSTPSPSSRSSPFTPTGRPGSVNPRDPLGLNPSPVPGGMNHHSVHQDKR